MSDKEHEIPVKVIDRRWWANQSDPDREDTRGAGKPAYVEQLEQQIAEKDKQIQEYLSKYRQASAEFEDARLRLRREISKDVERARRDVLAEILEVVDNLDRAIESARGGASHEALRPGSRNGAPAIPRQARHVWREADRRSEPALRPDRPRSDQQRPGRIPRAGRPRRRHRTQPDIASATTSFDPPQLQSRKQGY